MLDSFSRGNFRREIKTYLFFCIIGLLIWAVVYVVLGFNGLYGQDSYEYVRYTERWLSFFKEGNSPGDYFWPMAYPVVGSICSLLSFLPIGVSLQLISVAALSSNTYLVYRFLNYFSTGKNNSELILLSFLFFFAPYNFRSGFVVMSDQLATLFVLITYFCFYHILISNKKWLITFFVFTSLAIATRYVSLLLLLPPALFILVRERKKWGVMAIGLIAAVVPWIPHLYIRGTGSLSFLNHGALTKWSMQHFFMRVFDTSFGVNEFFAPNLVYVFSPFFHLGFSLLGVIVLFKFKKISKFLFMKVVIVSVCIYLLFLAGMYEQNSRFFILVFPLVFIMSMVGLFSWDKGSIYMKRGIVMLLLIQVSLSGWALSKTINHAIVEREIATYFLEQPKQVVYSFGMDVAMRYYCREQEFITLHLKDGFVPSTGSYCLFNKSWKYDRLKEKSPGKIYAYLERHNKLKRIKEFSQGWVLYCVE